MLTSMMVAATTTAVVWLTIGLVSTVALVAMLIALVRHVLLLGRTAMRLSDEISPLVDEIGRQSPGGNGSAGIRPHGTPGS